MGHIVAMLREKLKAVLLYVMCVWWAPSSSCSSDRMSSLKESITGSSKEEAVTLWVNCELFLLSSCSLSPYDEWSRLLKLTMTQSPNLFAVKWVVRFISTSTTTRAPEQPTSKSILMSNQRVGSFRWFVSYGGKEKVRNSALSAVGCAVRIYNTEDERKRQKLNVSSLFLSMTSRDLWVASLGRCWAHAVRTQFFFCEFSPLLFLISMIKRDALFAPI